MSAPEKTVLSLELILVLTAFAAGAVDIIAFAKLGGVLASAMTGNLALLGYYISRFSAASALGSVIALASYILGNAAGTLLSRTREQHSALRVLLSAELVFLAAAAALWMPTAHGNGSWSSDGIIALLALSMGFQGIVGKRVNLSNIPTVVFTSTLTNIVIAVTENLARGRFTASADTKRQCLSFSMYFFGALAAGFGVYIQHPYLIFLPFLAVAGALAAELASG